MSDPLARRLTDADPSEVRLLADDEMIPDSSVPMVSRSVRMPLDLYEWMQAEAKRRGLDSWSELARFLMEAARRPASEPAVPVAALEALLSKYAA
jgi:hypothetical protein